MPKKSTPSNLSQPPLDALPRGDTRWFTQARFGLFIHWGLYALGARHEWLMNNEEIPVEEYERRYFTRFDPDLYDPEAWAEAAARAGMKYFVVTTKHHEGFCLWDSKYTDYKAPNTPARRDLLKPMVEAFRKRGIRVGFYYSLIDWHHPDFILDDRIGPYRRRSEEERAALNKGRNQARYAAYIRNQVTELLTQFGEVDIIWFDFSYPPGEPHKPDDFTHGKGRLAWESETLYRLVRKLRPSIIIDDRLDLPNAWDVKTPEQVQPREWVTVDGQKVVWEACQTFSGSWGYHRDESSWRSTDELIRTLVDCVSKGGNLLLNVGPTARGEFDDRALERLQGIGEWMRRHSRAIYGCTAAPEDIPTPEHCRLTYNPETRRLYVHIFAWPYGHIHLDNLAGRVEYAQLLHDASELRPMDAWHANQLGPQRNTLTLRLPAQKPVATVPVIELYLKG